MFRHSIETPSLARNGRRRAPGLRGYRVLRGGRPGFDDHGHRMRQTSTGAAYLERAGPPGTLPVWARGGIDRPVDPCIPAARTGAICAPRVLWRLQELGRT